MMAAWVAVHAEELLVLCIAALAVLGWVGADRVRLPRVGDFLLDAAMLLAFMLVLWLGCGGADGRWL